MNIKLSPEHEQWLKARVAEGRFASPEAAVEQMIAERMALEVHDFSWARPSADAGRAAMAMGADLSLDETVADIEAHFASLKR